MKFLRYFLAFILVSLFLAVAIISVKLDAILHDAINTHGSKLLGTDVRIKKINLDLFNGDLKIMGLAVRNPSGFSKKNALYIPTLIVKTNPKNIFNKPVILDKIIIQSPVVNFELRDSSNNISILKKRLNKTHSVNESKKEPQDAPVDRKKEPAIQVKSISIKNIKLNADLKVINEELDLGTIELQGFEDGKYLPYEELIKQALEDVLQKIKSDAKLNVKIGDTQINILDKPQDIAKEVSGELQTYFKKTIKKILPN